MLHTFSAARFDAHEQNPPTGPAKLSKTTRQAVARTTGSPLNLIASIERPKMTRSQQTKDRLARILAVDVADWKRGDDMLTLYFSPGACSIAAHIVLQESGEEYLAQQISFANAEQRSETYLKMNPEGRVPLLILDDGEPLAENTAILPYLGKRFGLWPSDPVVEARVLSLIGFLATNVHPSVAHMWRPYRYASDPALHPHIQERGRETFDGYLREIDSKLAGREWFTNEYSVADPYLFVFYPWGLRRGYPMQELKHFSAFKDRMVRRAAVQQILSKENTDL